MYADKITQSMQRTIDETNRKRLKQIEYNKQHNITPTQIIKTQTDVFKHSNVDNNKSNYSNISETTIAAEKDFQYMKPQEIKKLIQEKKREMEKAAKELNFIKAARLRDEIEIIKDKVKSL
jgi:excinuclease ABC subunit B